MVDRFFRRKPHNQADPKLEDVLLRFLEITDINEVGDFLAANQVLLSNSADEVFQRTLMDASGQSDNERAVEAHWALVKRAKAVGISEGLAEYGFVRKELRPLVDALQKLTPREREVFEKRSGPDYEALLRQHPSLADVLSGLKEQIAESGPTEDSSDSSIPDSLRRRIGQASAAASRFEKHGRAEELDKAIELWSEVMRDPQFTQSSARFRAMVLNDVSGQYATRYQLSGRTDDLSSAIALLEKTSRLIPQDAKVLMNLGSLLMYRYASGGDIYDLDSAVETLRAAERLTPVDSEDRVMLLNNLGNTYVTKYRRSEDNQFIEKSLACWKELLNWIPADDPHRPVYLSNFGNALGAKNDKESLQRAAKVYRQVVKLTPKQSWQYARRIGNLGGALSLLYDHSGNINDLNAAREALEEAIDSTLPTAPNFPAVANSMADVLLDLYKLSPTDAGMQTAIGLFEQACEAGMVVDVSVALQSGGRWGFWALERGAWEEAARGFSFALRAFERLLHTQKSKADKETQLSSASDKKLFVNAAYAFARAGQLEAAVLALDYGRVQMMRERLEQHPLDVDALQKASPKLLHEYEAALYAIEAARTKELDESQTVSAERKLRDILATACQELERVLAEISQIRGFEELGAATDRFSRVASAVQPEDVFAYFVVTLRGSLILLLHRGMESNVTVEPIWIDDFTGHELGNLLAPQGDMLAGYLPPNSSRPEFEAGLSEVVTELGSNLLLHVARRARQLGATTVVLLPDGIMSLLPLHAASYGAGGLCLSDEFDVVYAPAAFLVSRSRQADVQLRSETTSFVGVGNPDGSAPQLEYAQAEVLQAESTFPASSSRAFLRADATKEKITEAIRSASHLHFACHGTVNGREPLNSHLNLANDEALTVRDLLRLGSFSKTRLAVLSACETALTGVDLPDEFINFPSSLLQVGVSGAIGTLWTVQDCSSMLLMAMFYKCLLSASPDRGGRSMSPAAALRMAQKWLKTATNEGIADFFSTMISSSHQAVVRLAKAKFTQYSLNPDPDARPFERPYFWAGFVLYGW
jgi:CHAT domain-containing protein/tetratricopeptide (TPR) repeat protein